MTHCVDVNLLVSLPALMSFSSLKLCNPTLERSNKNQLGELNSLAEANNPMEINLTFNPVQIIMRYFESRPTAFHHHFLTSSPAEGAISEPQ
jgi:hypothetical protein